MTLKIIEELDSYELLNENHVQLKYRDSQYPPFNKEDCSYMIVDEGIQKVLCRSDAPIRVRKFKTSVGNIEAYVASSLNKRHLFDVNGTRLSPKGGMVVKVNTPKLQSSQVDKSIQAANTRKITIN
ncbi:MAG: hypothetical protein OIF36_03750 [Alphaproteobacteria bacterium]|nr:hypothetical protein [Alphaproteobacteria bacterium]